MSCVPIQETVEMNNSETKEGTADAELLKESTDKQQELDDQSTSSSSHDSYESDVASSGDDCFESEKCFIHPLLERDIQLFNQYFPMESISYRILGDLSEIEIDLTVNLGFIEKSVIGAWGLCEDLPLRLRLNMNSVCYSYEKGFAKIEVLQGLTKKQTVVLLQLKNIAEAFSRDYFLSKSQGEKETTKTADDDESLENSSNETTGYLVKLYAKIKERLQTLNDHCPICDELHGATSMFKPTVCSRPLCIFSSQTMGVMCQVTDTFQTQLEVAYLLIALTHAAIFSSRMKHVLQPFPALMGPNSQEFIFSDHGDGLELLRKVMLLLHKFNLLNAQSEEKLRELLNLQHRHCYPLLRWVISSNRSHILCIPKEKQLPLLNTKHQFVLRNSPPAEDERFRALAEQHGSCFAFHGSPLENWHAIIRQGLVVASGTDLQLHGAALGRGIYVTPDLSYALNFAGGIKDLPEQVPQSPSPEKEIVGPIAPMMCVALCEVITGPKLKRKDRQRWIIEDSQHICTRFFFVYETNKCFGGVESTTYKFKESIKSILSDI